MSGQNISIVGAGVAGLSLAIMLAEQKIRCCVLEARLGFDGPTSGVRISAEGVRILRLMKVDSIGEETKRVDMRLGFLSASFSAPADDTHAIIVTRAALHEQLMKRVHSLGIPVLTGFKVASVTETVTAVEVTSDANQKVNGTLLVGADGVGSTIRHILNPNQSGTKAYAGYLGVGFIIEDDTKIEMTVHRYPGHQVAIASCGKVSEAATNCSIFIWTHIRMSEAEAKRATKASVEAELARRAAQWDPNLRRKYEAYTKDSNSILAFGPIYNGIAPSRWYSDRMILIGDAAHPYGPGGQGISMALKDAKALCDVITRGFTEDGKKEFQRTRAEEARRLGEAAEKRNSKGSPSSKWGIFAEGVVMKVMELFTRGTLKF